ncbi:ferrochelatase [Adlercreutzia sp. ZJ304]|uniref:ferrochelatase n=1 Tax=Adlercreutzia sp. ZJ304 TaxID=2709791 RepID=UPI0013EAFC3A|nr:ferrochelatase [Adlercreutzia sp. ZJ304]
MDKLGILIANTGSPSAPTPDAVRIYLREFLNDPRIRPMNPILWKAILGAFILPKRSVASAEKYQSIWTTQGSPLSASMASLARKLENNLDECIVKETMSYGSPSMPDTLRELRDAGCDQLIAIPLYPQSAYSTTGVVKDKLNAALAKLNWNPKLTFVENYWEQEAYLDAVANSVLAAGFSKNDKLMIAFHSIPMRDVTAGDTYAEQAKVTAAEIANRLHLAPDCWRIGFQCRFDSRKWVGPFTTEALQHLQNSVGKLFVVAPNFSIDCLETLHDIEVTLRQNYLRINQDASPDSFVYVPCLNDSDAHVHILKTLIYPQE